MGDFHTFQDRLLHFRIRRVDPAPKFCHLRHIRAHHLYTVATKKCILYSTFSNLGVAMIGTLEMLKLIKCALTMICQSVCVTCIFCHGDPSRKTIFHCCPCPVLPCLPHRAQEAPQSHRVAQRITGILKALKAGLNRCNMGSKWLTFAMP